MSEIEQMEEVEKVAKGDTHAEPPPKAFVAVTPQQLEQTWALVKDDLAKVDNPDETPLEEIYFMLKTNQATLFLLYVKGEYIGFAVVRLILPDLHLWLVHAKNGFECLKVFRPEIMQLARNANAKMVTFGSRRRAWQEVSKDHGFNVRAIMYQCPVDKA